MAARLSGSMPKAGEGAAFSLAASETTLSILSCSHLIDGQQRLRQQLQNDARRRQPPRHRHQQPPAVDRGSISLHALAEGLHLRPAEFVDGARPAPCPLPRRQSPVRRRRRRPAGSACARRRTAATPAEPRQRGEAIEEMVLRSERDRRAEDDRTRAASRTPRLRPPPWCARRRGRIRGRRRSPKCGPAASSPAAARGLGDGARAEHVDRVEALAAGLGKDRDQIDDGIGAVDSAVDRPAIAQVRLHRLHPADHAERLQVAGKVGPAHRRAHAPAALQQRPNDVASDKAGPAEDRHQTLVGVLIGMPLSASSPHARSASYRLVHVGCQRGVRCTPNRRALTRLLRRPYLSRPMPRWRNW